MAAGRRVALVLQNYESQVYTHLQISAPIRAVVYSDPRTWTFPFQHAAANAYYPTACGGDARAVFDPDTDAFFYTALGNSGIGYDSYCIGVGGEETDGPAWTWNRIYFNGHSGDGAQIAVTQTEAILIGIKDVLHCDKNSLRTASPSCYWQATGPIQGTIPVVAKNGSVAVGTFVGFSGSNDPQHPGQLQVGYTDGTPPNPVLYGDVTSYMSDTFVHTPDAIESIPFELRNAVYDVHSDLMWVGFQAKCQTSGGNHVCMGAIEILVHPYPILWGVYQFDGPYNAFDGFLGGITVDHDGYVLATWVASSPTQSDSMAVGGFAPDQQGYHYLTAAGNWRIVNAGQGGAGIDSPDYTECDAVPDTTLVIAHGLHKAAYLTGGTTPCPGPSYYGQCIGFHFASDLAAFNHCCDPRTGTCPQSGCP